MKRVLICLFCFSLLLACVPTPEQDAVKQKDTNILIETIKADQQEQQKADAIMPTMPPVKELLPERFQCDFTTSQKNVRVTSDVPIEILTSDTFPVFRVERRTLTNEERMTVAERIFGTEELFIWEEQISRKDLERMIRELMQEPTPQEKKRWMKDTDATEEEWQELLARRKALAEDYQRQYNELPEDDSRKPLKKWDGSVPDYAGRAPNQAVIVRDQIPEGYQYQQNQLTVYADDYDRPLDYCVAWRNDSDVTWASFYDGPHKFGASRINPSDYDKPHENAVVTPNDAVQLVQGIFSGIVDLIPSDIYWANNAATDGDVTGVQPNTRWGYLIHFTQNYKGAYSPYCQCFSIDYDSDAGFSRMWNYENLLAVVDGEGNLISLDWNAPLKVTETIAESTSLLPYEDVQAIFAQQMDRVFSWESHLDGTLNVDVIQLGLFRIREKNNLDSALLVPAWFFTGVFDYSEEAQAERLSDGLSASQAAHSYYDSLNPLCIINAIDGSIIDPMKGY